jgi:Kef-type K+ transport system membrane component KefB
MHADIVLQISIALIAAAALAFAARWARQPLILAYVASGVLVGATEGFGWVRTEDIEPISELGLILLLFMIGLEIDLKKLREAGKAVVAAGIGQFAICVALGFGIAPFLLGKAGGGRFDTLYFAICCALSSTMIVVKLLYDKFELDTIPGRITLGILVFQDIWAILFLAMQHSLNQPQFLSILLSLLKGIGLVVVALAAARFALPVVFRSIARTPEAVLITALAWCFGVSAGAAYLGLSREMGALVAGVAISAFPYNLDVVAKIITLRDFFVTLFFVSLGTKIPRPAWDVMAAAGLASAFVIVSRFLSVTPILHALRSGNRVSTVPAMNLSQISEFSLVICTLGLGFGHVSERLLSIVVFTLVITAVLSTYAILYNYEIFSAINPLLRKLGMRDLGDLAETGPQQNSRKDIVFLGFSRYASSLLEELLGRDPLLAGRVRVIDFNPQVKQELDRREISNLYGDVSHLDTLQHAKVGEAKVLLSTIPDSILKGTTNLRLLRQLQRTAPQATIIVTAEFFYAARELYAQGAAFVFIPRLMSVRDLVEVVQCALNSSLDHRRTAAIEELETRAEVLP